MVILQSLKCVTRPQWRNRCHGEINTKVMQGFGVVFVVIPSRLLNKQSNCWWSETPWCLCDCNEKIVDNNVVYIYTGLEWFTDNEGICIKLYGYITYSFCVVCSYIYIYCVKTPISRPHSAAWNFIMLTPQFSRSNGSLKHFSGKWHTSYYPQHDELRKPKNMY